MIKNKVSVIKSCYFPFKANNPYVKNIMTFLNESNIETISVKEVLLKPKIFKEVTIFNFNWFENIESSGNIKKNIEYLIKYLIITWIKINKKKIIYTLHNKIPHSRSSDKLSISLMKKLIKNADNIIVMCDDSYNILNTLNPEENIVNKVKKIQHPSYLRNYSNEESSSIRCELNLKNDELVFLFIGFIAPYKNIELLIQIFNKMKEKNLKLIIAGRPITEEYKNKLLKEINDNCNIITKFEYIPDSEIVNYYKSADIIVLPYDKRSSLNSGTVFLSFTLGKTVVCPNIGTINDLKDKSFIFNYEYNNEKEHLNELNKIISAVYEDFERDRNIIKNKGNKALEYVKKYHNDNQISKEYNKLYKSLLESENIV